MDFKDAAELLIEISERLFELGEQTATYHITLGMGCAALGLLEKEDDE